LRHKLSFAVDRTEIDISSDWVQAVMQPPSLPSVAGSEPKVNSGAMEAATVEQNPPVVENATVTDNTTGALFGHSYNATVEINSSVEQSTTVEKNPTVEGLQQRRTLRLRPIRQIMDGLTPGQQLVYERMFEKAEPDLASGRRLFRGGYIDLVRLTGLSKRGIQNVVAELQDKSVITLHQAPGYHRSQTSVYEVAPKQVVLERWFAQGLRYATGKSKRLLNIATVE
jgi:hypothetical protein